MPFPMPMIRMIRVLLLLLVPLWGQEVPKNLFEKAYVFVERNGDDADTREKLSKLRQGDIDTLYQVAQSMNDEDRVTSVQIWHALADDETSPHLLSQVALGFAYSEVDKARAIAYFVEAGENGPHQAALYNAGRLLAEQHDYSKALAYIRAAANLQHANPKYIKPQLTETCRQAYDTLSQQIMTLPNLSLQASADMFLYASISDFPPPNTKQDKIWRKAMQALQQHDYVLAEQQFDTLADHPHLSMLQSHLLKALKMHAMINIKDNDL